jgi:biotin-(acetyl-CoA carboxylase) ligase
VTPDGRKLGGVLLEAGSEDRCIRVGIGLNRSKGSVDGEPVAGWDEYTEGMSAMQVFKLLDSSISSLFEDHPLVPCVNDDELVALSWRALSKSLSRGVDISLEGESLRAVGLSPEGHLLTETAGEEREVSAVGGLEWAPVQ